MPDVAYDRGEKVSHEPEAAEGVLLGRKLHYVASSEKDLSGFPKEAIHEVAFAIRMALIGGKAIHAVPLVGFGGSRVLEIITALNGDAYRTVYTVRFDAAVYVLHAFKKKSTRGRSTPKREIDVIKSRLRSAERHYQLTYESKARESKDVQPPRRS